MTEFEKLRFVQNRLTTAAEMEQLAEECVELAHAALKMARIHRGENPTPADVVEVGEKLYEEAADVMLCLNEIGFEKANIDARMRRKLERWVQRLADVEPVETEDENDD